MFFVTEEEEWGILIWMQSTNCHLLQSNELMTNSHVGCCSDIFLIQNAHIRHIRQRHKKFKEECFIYQTGTSPFDFTVQCFFDGFGVRQTLAPSNGLQWLSIIRPMIPLVKV